MFAVLARIETRPTFLKRSASLSSPESGPDSAIDSASSLVSYFVSSPVEPLQSPDARLIARKQTRPAPVYTKEAELSRALRQKTWSECSLLEKLNKAALFIDEDYYEVRKLERGPIPTYPVWKHNLIVLGPAFLVPLLHHISLVLAPTFRWSIMLLAVLSIVSFFSYAIWIFRLCSMWARHYGTLDEANHGRGHLPDKDVGRVPWGSLLALFGRPLVAILLADLDLSKSLFAGLSLGSPVRLFAATLTWDYFYYVAHRSTHENKHLWKLHAHHHASVYPSPNMSATADYFQELVDSLVMPTLTALCVSMSYLEMSTLLYYVLITELLGHSGLRCIMGNPLVGPVLSLFGCEVAVEDHDLHHRYGQRAGNYGKQTRLFDRLFGTCDDRIEMKGY